MKNIFEDYQIKIGESSLFAINRSVNVHQDGTTPFCRDKDGTLWAISGHSHSGEVAMFNGTCLDDLKYAYPINLNFCVGHADYAFNRVCYPEGIKARGSVWPFGLYICPNTGRFFAFFHNETGWFCRGTEYDSFGHCETPRYDSDFRHIGMMHSDDKGKTWTFDRWVLSAEEVCFTELHNPDAVNVIGQKADIVSLGSGDFTLFVDYDAGYLYIIYNIVRVDIKNGFWAGCDAYIARSRIRGDGIVPDFIKYYNGSFCEPGNFGKETPIALNSWHAKAVYSKLHDCYILTSTRVTPGRKPPLNPVDGVMQIRTGKCLTEWSEPITVCKDGKEWGNHYLALVSDSKDSSPSVLTEDSFSLLSNHNGTDVLRYKVNLRSK